MAHIGTASRKGKAWSSEEETLLLESIQNKKNIETIALEHERTHGGILSRLQKIAVEDFIEHKHSLDTIEAKTGLTTEEILYAVNRYNTKIEAMRYKSERIGSSHTNILEALVQINDTLKLILKKL